MALSVSEAPVTLASTVRDVTAGSAWSASGEPSGSSAQDTATLGSTWRRLRREGW